MKDWLNTPQNFGGLSKGFHWTVGLTIISLLCVGLFMSGLERENPIRGTLYMTHKSIGLMILPIAILWVVLWLYQRKPDPLPEIPTPMHRFSKLVHGVLIFCAVGMPLSGWAMSSGFSGNGVNIFNLFTIPPLVERDPEFGRAMLGAHILISWFIMGFGGLHIAAALYHHFIRKNVILQRMLPFDLNSKIRKKKKKKKTSKVVYLGRK